jgi:N,N'-diacetyllegionaminate synthase
MRIGDLDTDQRVLVVAELGNNHEGDLARARRLVEEAAAAGADAVKLQVFRTEHFVSRSDEKRFKRLEQFRLEPAAIEEVAELARAQGLLFFATPLDLGSAAFLSPIVDALKVASGDNDFFPLLELAARSGRPLIVSAGLAGLDELGQTVAFVERERPPRHDLALLHCVSSYPAPAEETNLRAIPLLAERFPGWTIGYSDHTLGIDAAVLAVAAGASIVEKHFTLDKELSDFRDHQLSADPPELRELVRRIRLAEQLLGHREKELQASEAPIRDAIRRSIVAARELPARHRLTADDLIWTRPGGGLPPGEEHVLLGRQLRHSVAFGDQLSARDVL